MRTIKGAIVAMAAAAGLSATPVQAQTLGGADLADVQCLTIFAAILGSGATLTDDQRTGIIAGAIYYLGRLQGRTPDTDWYAAIGRFADTAQDTDLEPHRGRCTAEMATVGGALGQMGAAAAAN